MKKIVFLTAFFFLFTGCTSWQNALTFGLLNSSEEEFEENLKSGCENKDAVFCNNLAVYFSDKDEFYDAKRYYQKACDLGLATACSNLGQIYEKGLAGDTPNITKALKLYQYACDNLDGVGCYNEALATYSHSLEDQKENNLIIAKALFKKSCDLDYKRACILLKEFDK